MAGEEFAILKENTYFFLSISEEIKENVALFQDSQEADLNFRIYLEEALAHKTSEIEQKSSLGFRIAKLPKDSREIEKLYGDKCCAECSKKADYLCMLCNGFFCSDDDMEAHKKTHGNSLIYFSIAKGQVFVEKNKQKEYFDLYYDPFRVPYKDKEETDIDPFILVEEKEKKAERLFF